MWSNASASSAVVSATAPSTTATTRASRYCGTSSASALDVAGDSSEGLTTTVLPAASAATSGASSELHG